MKTLIFILVVLFSSQAFSQLYQDPKQESAKAQQEAWAAAQKAKAKNDAIVAEQRAEENKYKGLKKSNVKINVYGGENKGGSISQ
jgi:hypothetical protein